jgi:DNA-binding IclR family transcriptional regulator
MAQRAKDLAEPLGADDGQNPRLGEVKNVVKPVVNALRILRYLSATGKPARAAHIARSLSINVSTCFNILRTMAGEDIVAFDPLSKTYRIGFGLAKLAGSSLTEGQRLDAAKPLIHELNEQFGATATLWRRTGRDRIVLVSVEYSPTGMRVHMPTGTRLPLLMGSTGRLFATYSDLSKAEVRAAFKDLRWARPLSFDDYWRQAQEAVERGWALDDGYFGQGITSVGVPVVDSAGAMAFSLVCVTFRGQFDASGLEKLSRAMIALSGELQRILC